MEDTTYDYESEETGESASLADDVYEIAPDGEADDRPAPKSKAPRPWRPDSGGVLVYILLALVLVVAAWLRFDAQNWDDFSHLHPDERFFVQVVGSLNGLLRFTDGSVAEQDAHRLRCEDRYPPTASSAEGATIEPGHGGYFDAECSALNPNNVGYGMYVYGEFPLFTIHAAGVARSQLSRDYHVLLEAVDPEAAAKHTVTTYWEGYTGIQLVGRTVSAVADWLTVIVVFLIGRRLYGRWTGLLAAALYGVAAFPIQQAHFWTVDAFTTFWVALALYCAVRAMDGAGVQQGPRPLLYLAIWAGAVVWDAAYENLPGAGAALPGRDRADRARTVSGAAA